MARADGFTLIEVVVTVAIVAVLASVAVPMTGLVVQRGKERDLRNALVLLRGAIDAYKQAADDGRIVKSADQSGYPPTLESLVNGVEDAKDPKKHKIYFLRRIPRDPMFNNGAAHATETWGKRSYASSADDPREGEDVFDIYSLSAATGLDGVPYREW